jgi:CRP-like cAMP-binding protein
LYDCAQIDVRARTDRIAPRPMITWRDGSTIHPRDRLSPAHFPQLPLSSSAARHGVVASNSNRILAALPPAEMERIEPHLYDRRLTLRELLYEGGHRVDEVCFPDTGMVSLVVMMTTGSGTENAVVGAEGFSGISQLFHMSSAHERAIVQVAGAGRCLSGSAFQKLRRSCETFDFLVHRYAFALFAFAAQTSACNRRHTSHQRLSRWLLLAQDRAGNRSLPITHHFMGMMLGVRRSTVTTTADDLRREGLITYGRGHLEIIDRPALIHRACECYESIRVVYAAALSVA